MEIYTGHRLICLVTGKKWREGKKKGEEQGEQKRGKEREERERGQRRQNDRKVSMWGGNNSLICNRSSKLPIHQPGQSDYGIDILACSGHCLHSAVTFNACGGKTGYFLKILQTQRSSHVSHSTFLY